MATPYPTDLKSELTRPIPGRILSLPRARGYPVPWFVAWQDADGRICDVNRPGAVPEFRCMDGDKFRRALREKRCWVCGDPLGKWFTFVAGPMCGINRTSGEPPCHTECAEWSARNCPFLCRPHMDRRENDLPEASNKSPFMLERNPGVTLLWTTRGYAVFDGAGKALLEMGEPRAVSWWREGRPATLAEVEESIAGGLPFLEGLCAAETDVEAALAELRRRHEALKLLYPRI